MFLGVSFDCQSSLTKSHTCTVRREEASGGVEFKLTALVLTLAFPFHSGQQSKTTAQ